MAYGTSVANFIAVALSMPTAPTAHAHFDTPVHHLASRPASSEMATWFGFSATDVSTAPNTTHLGFSSGRIKSGVELERATTAQEDVIGELRAAASLAPNWDGEGAERAISTSIEEAVSFVNLLAEDQSIPEAMLHPNGRSGLYWNDDKVYADLEFTGDGRVTYYIELKGSGKHKGVVNFHGKKMPPVFTALLRS